MINIILAMILQMNVIINNPKTIDEITPNNYVSQCETITDKQFIEHKATETKKENKKNYTNITSNTNKVKSEKINNCLICGNDKGNYTSVCETCLINEEFEELPKMNTETEEQQFYDWHYFNEDTKKWELM